MTEGASTVLVVDDSAFMRKLIAEIIESSGAFHVIGTAGDGVEALQKIRTLKPDIVTLDIEMPRLNGLQALEQIMAEMPRPVVMLSAAGSDLGNEMTLRALERGALDFVRKPSGPVSIDLSIVRSAAHVGSRSGAGDEHGRHADVGAARGCSSPRACSKEVTRRGNESRGDSVLDWRTARACRDHTAPAGRPWRRRRDRSAHAG